jgi:hypothetical protein
MTAPKNIQGRRTTWNTTEHSGFKACLDAIMDVHASHDGLYAEGVHIIGATGVGKTQLAQAVLARFPPYKDRHGPIIRVVYVEVPTLPTKRSLMVAILRALGDPRYDRGNAEELKDRVVVLIKEARVELIFFDEVQHFMLQGGKVAMCVAADVFKSLINELQVPIVIMGMPSLAGLFAGNSQLRTRLGPPMRLKAFAWDGKKQTGEFLGLIAGQFPLGFENDDFLFNADVAHRLWLATFGVPRGIRFFLFKLDKLRLAGNVTRLDHALLSKTFRAQFWPSAPPERDPFNARFTMAALIGPGEPWEPDPIEGGHHDASEFSVAAAIVRKRMGKV